MNVRKVINEKPALAACVAGTVCVLIFGIVAWEALGRRSNPQAAFANKTFFSDDDGTTWFIDSDSNIPPFDHNGKQAYRAAVYRCGTGKPFVAYLERYSSTDLDKLKEARKLQADRNPGGAPTVGIPNDILMDVKKPGESMWLHGSAEAGKFDAAAYQKATHPVCPDGSAGATVVQPFDADAQ